MKEIRESIVTDLPHAVRVPFKLTFADNGKVIAKLPKGVEPTLTKTRKVVAFSAAATVDIGYAVSPSGAAAVPAALMASATCNPTVADTTQDIAIKDITTEELEVVVTIGGAPAAGAIRGYIEYHVQANAVT